MHSYGHPHMAEKKQDVLLEPTYNSSVPIYDVALKTYRKRWMIGRGSGRGSGRSVLMVRDDDDDDDYVKWINEYHFMNCIFKEINDQKLNTETLVIMKIFSG